MEPLYFELDENDLIFELSQGYDIGGGIDITSNFTQFLTNNNTEIELVLLGYFAGKGMDPKNGILGVKNSIRRQAKQGATSFSVYID